MGLFKDIRDVGKRGKELGDYHGGMPSWKQGMKDFRAVTDDGGEREVMKKGEPASAKVLGLPMQVPGERFRDAGRAPAEQRGGRRRGRWTTRSRPRA